MLVLSKWNEMIVERNGTHIENYPIFERVYNIYNVKILDTAVGICNRNAFKVVLNIKCLTSLFNVRFNNVFAYKNVAVIMKQVGPCCSMVTTDSSALKR